MSLYLLKLELRLFLNPLTKKLVNFGHLLLLLYYADGKIYACTENTYTTIHIKTEIHVGHNFGRPKMLKLK